MPSPKEHTRLRRSVLILEDGVHLSYYYIGKGPGVIIVHGALSFALTQLDLAVSLSDHYTVYLPSRRGRGLSGQYPETVTGISRTFNVPSSDLESPPSYDLKMSTAVLNTDVSDLAALIKHTNSIFALGVSSGASILLESCVVASLYPDFHRIKKAIIFEPPIFLTDNPSTGPEGIDITDIGRYDKEMENGDLTSALTTMTMLAKLGPKWLQASPRFVVRLILGIASRLEKREIQKRGKPRDANHATNEADIFLQYEDQGVTTMEGLAPLLRYDFAAIIATRGPLSKYSKANNGRDILLLGGSESPKYLKQGLKSLNEIMEGAQMIEIEGVGHGVLASKMWGGDVERAVGKIRAFFV
jgi:pimeloyl-ACP methyl ester carboxylesterase